MADNQFDHPFGEMAKRYRKFRRELPAVVSNMAVNDFKENFRRGGYRTDSGIRPWRKRKKATGKKSDSRAILVKSGRLKRSLRAAPTYDEARVVTNVPYAEIHNEGFEGTVNVKAHKRYKWSSKKVKAKTKTGKLRTKTVKRRESAIKVKAHKRKVKMPARPFMVTTAPLIRGIDHYVLNELDSIFNKS